MPEQTTPAVLASRTPLSRTESAVNCRQSAFSLIELLIAMTLGLILIAGMITVLEGNRRSSELNSTMADLQESARFASGRHRSRCSHVGFSGLYRHQQQPPQRCRQEPACKLRLQQPGDIRLAGLVGYLEPCASTWFYATERHSGCGRHTRNDPAIWRRKFRKTR